MPPDLRSRGHKKTHFMYKYNYIFITYWGFPVLSRGIKTIIQLHNFITYWEFPLVSGDINTIIQLHNFITYWGFPRLRGRLSWRTCCPPWIQCLCCPHSKCSQCSKTVGFYKVYLPPDRENWSLWSFCVVHQAIPLQENL